MVCYLHIFKSAEEYLKSNKTKGYHDNIQKGDGVLPDNLLLKNIFYEGGVF